MMLSNAHNLETLHEIGPEGAPHRVRRCLGTSGEPGADGPLCRYEVEDAAVPGRRLVLCLLPPDADDAMRQRFERVRALLAETVSAHLPTLIDTGRDHATGAHYFTTRFVEGPTLGDLHYESHEGRIASFSGLLEAMSEIHERGVVHGEIQASSALALRDGRVLLTQLGSVAREEEATRPAGPVSRFSSPEVLRGANATARSDVFSAGVVLYELLSAHHLYHGIDEVDVQRPESIAFHIGVLAASSRPIDLEWPADVPRVVRKAVERACSLDPARRYEDCKGFALALGRVGTKAASTTTRPSSASGFFSRAAAVAAVVVIGALSFTTWNAVSRAQRGDAERDAMKTAHTKELAVQVVASLALVPNAAPSAVDRAVRQLNAGDRQYQNGLAAIERDESASAHSMFELASRTYRDLCSSTLRSVVPSSQEAASGGGADPCVNANRLLSLAAKDLQGQSAGAAVANAQTDAGSEISALRREASPREAPAQPLDTRSEPVAVAASPVPVPVASAVSVVPRGRKAPTAPEPSLELSSARPVAAVSAGPVASTIRANSVPTAAQTSVSTSADPRVRTPVVEVAPTEEIRRSVPATSPATRESAVVQATGETPPELLTSAATQAPESKPRLEQADALATLEEYELAYETRDFARLQRVWQMTAAQGRAMRDFFSRMDRITLDTTDHLVRMDSTGTAIDFSLRIVARGLARSASTKGPVAMTARVQPVADGRWKIASLGPQ